MKDRKFPSKARATSHLASQKLLETIVIVRSVFTTRLWCQMRHYHPPN